MSCEIEIFDSHVIIDYFFFIFGINKRFYTFLVTHPIKVSFSINEILAFK